MFYKSFTTLAAFALTATTAYAETALPFALDWKFEGPAAPFFTAIEAGYFADQDLSVEISAGQGSLDAIPKVATGAYPVGMADINSLVKFLDQNPGAPVTAIMMIYDAPAFSVVGRKSLGIEAPKDLEGHVLGAPPPDGAWAQFPIFAAENDLDMSKITVEPVGFPTREPMLAEGKVDAVTGFNFSSYLNLVRLGVPEDDISTIMMSDFGVSLYGNVLLVNTDFAAEHPDAIKGFLTAVVAGWKDAVVDPKAAVENMVKYNPASDVDLETRRLELALEGNVLTDYVVANGFGGIDAARFEGSLEQLGMVYEFKAAPDASLYFTDAYLPAAADRMLK
ncbi:ABC transporter substrate-binding protein [Celeribacter baekdonensis]|uniref:ABC transporter substrate-binding protein n=1 Tax=Celeribacter baekdonensis TaxID=875171 RepID=A0A2R4M6R7_9RHOB|nr:ABC transporter substrate-binding protein [Celeribacter baekdonensis]AVW92911.1 ABC transporter substrate-binding protein [Celeribacter baekdonensis]